MYAIIETGGKQYKVSAGDTVWVEKLPAEEGAEVAFDRVLMLSKDDEVLVGSPLVEGAVVKGKVVEHGRGPKIRVFKYKNKVKYRKTQGHRQPFTCVAIESIEA